MWRGCNRLPRTATPDEGLRSDGLTTAEREELNRLPRENRVLREKRKILSKAAAWFYRRGAGHIVESSIPASPRATRSPLASRKLYNLRLPLTVDG